jgi:NADH dehydrogenase
VKHVVIVGGGFAGLNCGKKLAKHSDVRVTLIDKNNYQQFQPLLYQVAAADLSPTNVAFSLRGVILRDHPNVDVKMSEVVSVDLSTRTVHTAEGQTYQGRFSGAGRGDHSRTFGTPELTSTAIHCTHCMTPKPPLADHRRFECADRDRCSPKGR